MKTIITTAAVIRTGMATAQDGDVVGGEVYTQLSKEFTGQFKYARVGVDIGFD